MAEDAPGEKLCASVKEALAKLLQGTGLSPDHVTGVDIDPFGPRIIIALEPPWAKKVVLDASPDGVETTLVLDAPGGLEPEEAEEALLEAIEEAPGVEALDEYDAAYDPEEAEALIELHAARLTHLPNLAELARRAKNALEKSSA